MGPAVIFLIYTFNGHPMNFLSPISPISSSLGLRGSCLHHSPHCSNPTETGGCSPSSQAERQTIWTHGRDSSSLVRPPHRKPWMSRGSAQPLHLASSGSREKLPKDKSCLQAPALKLLSVHRAEGRAAALHPQMVQGCRCQYRCPKAFEPSWL